MNFKKYYKFSMRKKNKNFLSVAVASFVVLGTTMGGQVGYANNQEKNNAENTVTKEDNAVTSKLEALAESKENKDEIPYTDNTVNADEPSAIFVYPEEENVCDFDLKRVINTAGELAGRLLSGSEIEFLCDLNEKLHFPTELIIYLYEYCCLEKNINRFNYIQSVALAWADKDINTVEAAKTEADIYNKENAAVMKAFGLSRLPGTSEKQYISNWFHSYNMSEEMITEACNRTLLNLSKPDFKYTDGTLKNWLKSGITDLDGVKNADKIHYMTKQSLNAANNALPKPVNNRFTNFEQRNYSEADMANIIQKWAEKV